MAHDAVPAAIRTLVKGGYIRPNEGEDGFATIDGAVVKLDGTQELRERPIRPFYLFIATKHSPILLSGAHGEADDLISEFIEKHESQVTAVEPSELEALFKLPRHPTSLMYQ